MIELRNILNGTLFGLALLVLASPVLSAPVDANDGKHSQAETSLALSSDSVRSGD